MDEHTSVAGREPGDIEAVGCNGDARHDGGSTRPAVQERRRPAVALDLAVDDECGDDLHDGEQERNRRQPGLH